MKEHDRYAVELLIKSGADINAPGDMSETPLQIAVRQEDLEFIEMLLKAGANIDLRSEFNETAAESSNKKGGAIEELFRAYSGA